MGHPDQTVRKPPHWCGSLLCLVPGSLLPSPAPCPSAQLGAEGRTSRRKSSQTRQKWDKSHEIWHLERVLLPTFGSSVLELVHPQYENQTGFPKSEREPIRKPCLPCFFSEMHRWRWWMMFNQPRRIPEALTCTHMIQFQRRKSAPCPEATLGK